MSQKSAHCSLGSGKKNAYLGKLPSNCFPYCKKRGHLHKKTFQLEACKDSAGSWFCDQSSKENSHLVLLPLGGLSVLSTPSAGAAAGSHKCISALQFLTVFTEIFFLILFPHHLFLTLCASHITKSTASAANLWISVICFADFLPKVAICSTTVQYLSLQIFTHCSSPQLLNGINSLHKDLAQEEKLQKSLHHFSCCHMPGL